MNQLHKFIIVFAWTNSCSQLYGFENNLKEKFRWKTLDYNFENSEARNRAIEKGEYIPENNVPYGVEVWRDKLIVTVPRRSRGIPSTLNYVPLNSKQSSPQLNPYPNWASNKLSSKFLVSTFRATADQCDRLWTVDTGAAPDFPATRPRILIFDLKTDSLLKEHWTNAEDNEVCGTSYTNIAVDLGASCADAFGYAVDPRSSGLLVYSLKDDDSWRLEHPYFRPDPLRCNYNIGDLNFQWTDGLFGIALTERKKSGFRDVLMHATSSLLELVTSTELLRNKTTASRSWNAIKILGSRDETFQAASSAYDEKSGVLFHSLVNKNAISGWNRRKFGSYSGKVADIVAASDETLIYICDLKIDEVTSSLWVISNKLPVLRLKPFNPNDFNFHVLTANIRDLIKNKLCAE